MKFIRLSFLILGLASILWLILPRDKLPQISFPKGAQHNTFGELPVVEVMDDGNFYEKDGDENLSPQNCNKKISDECEAECNKKWVKDVMCSASCYLLKVNICDELLKKQRADAYMAGEFTAGWMTYMEQECGTWACDDKKAIKRVKQKLNKESMDKMTWIGNQGNFPKGEQ